MKNQGVGWGLVGTSVLAVLAWSWTTGSYFMAWGVLGLGLLIVAIRNPDWCAILAGYFGLFAVVSQSSLPTRWMLTGLVSGLLAAVAIRKLLRTSDGAFWLMILLIISLPIATFSGSAGSAGGWSEWLIQVLGLEGTTAETVIWWVRKSLHFTVYGSLAYAAFRALQHTGSNLSFVSVLAVVWSLSHAGFDEIKQLSIPGRTGSPMDLIIDLAGALTAIAIAYRRTAPETV